MPVLAKRSIGDAYSVPCLECGKEMGFQDLTTDGCLNIGTEGECEHCGAPWVIDEVEYTATVWVVSRPGAGKERDR